MKSVPTRRPIQLIRRSVAVGAWGGRGAILVSVIDFGIIMWNLAVRPVSPTVMTVMGWASLAPLALLATLFTCHVRIGIQSPRAVDKPKSVANDRLAISSWLCLAQAIVCALVLISLGA